MKRNLTGREGDEELERIQTAFSSSPFLHVPLLLSMSDDDRARRL
jgi:hypothetical protein